jgi:hypothetical protein
VARPEKRSSCGLDQRGQTLQEGASATIPSWRVPPGIVESRFRRLDAPEPLAEGWRRGGSPIASPSTRTSGTGRLCRFVHELTEAADVLLAPNRTSALWLTPTTAGTARGMSVSTEVRSLLELMRQTLSGRYEDVAASAFSAPYIGGALPAAEVEPAADSRAVQPRARFQLARHRDPPDLTNYCERP